MIATFYPLEASNILVRNVEIIFYLYIFNHGDNFDEILIGKMEIERKTEHLLTKEDLSAIFADLKKDIEGLKISLIKWMFIFWIGQMVVVAGICYCL